jgi:hypothetical protein
MQVSFEMLSRDGMFARRTVGAPVTQGAGITGRQGMGVSTPRAAAVAAATAGFAIELHIANGMMFTIGM